MPKLPKFDDPGVLTNKILEYQALVSTYELTYSNDPFANACVCVLRNKNYREFLALPRQCYDFMTTDIKGALFCALDKTRNYLTGHSLLVTVTIWNTYYNTRELQARLIRASRNDDESRYRLIPLIVAGILPYKLDYHVEVDNRPRIISRNEVVNHIAQGAPIYTKKYLRRNAESVDEQYIKRSKFHFIEQQLFESKKKRFLNGMVTNTEYTITSPLGVYEFIDLVAGKFCQTIQDEIRANMYNAIDDREVPYLSVIVRYDVVDRDGRIKYTKREAIFRGIGFTALGAIYMLQFKKTNLSIEEIRNRLKAQVEENILEYDENHYDTMSSDIAGKYLDIGWFQIQKIDIVMSGGSNDDKSRFKRFIDDDTRSSHAYSSQKLSWCKITNYQSKDNKCFFQVLFMTFKDKFKATGINNCTQLRSVFRTDEATINTMVSIKEACSICSELGIKVIIYDVDGSIIMQNDGIDDLGYNRLDMLFSYHHYVKITKIYSTSAVPYLDLKRELAKISDVPEPSKNELKEKLLNNFSNIRLEVLYDFETVNDAYRPGYESQVHCYSVSYKFRLSYDDKVNIMEYAQLYNQAYEKHVGTGSIFYHDCGKDRSSIDKPYNLQELYELLSSEEIRHFQTDQPSNDTVIGTLLEEIIDYVNYLSIPANISVIMIAYNGSNFDHVMLHNYLISKRYVSSTPPALHGKLKFMMFRLHEVNRMVTSEVEYKPLTKENSFDTHYWNCMYNSMPEKLKDAPNDKWLYTRFNFNVSLSIWDPCLFLYRSLESAAMSFGIDMKKNTFSHVEVQSAYESGEFSKFMAENSDKIREYNDQDVRILEEVVIKLLDSCREISGGVDARGNATIAQMSYNIWRSIVVGVDENQLPIRMGQVVKRVEDYEVDCFIREAIVGGRVQGKRGYWIGDYVFVDVVSLYPFVMANRSYPVGKETVIKDDIDKCSECLMNVDLIGIYECIVDQSGCTGVNNILPHKVKGCNLDWHYKGEMKVKITDYDIELLVKYNCRVELTGNAVVWQRSKEGFVFGEIIDKMCKMKKAEDEKKSRGDNGYNPAKREMSKMSMNSLSGKMSQKVFKHEVKQWTAGRETEMRKYISSHLGACVYELSDDMWYTEAEKNKYYGSSCKPSQVGVMIYSNARGYMYEEIYSRYEVWYGDTDSAVIRREDYEDLVKRGKVWGGVGDKVFGMFENEEKEYGKIYDMYVIAPKCYAVFFTNGKVKIKVKGVRESDMYVCGDELVKIRGNERGLMTMLMNGNVEVKTEHFKKLIGDKSFEFCRLTKVLKGGVADLVD